MRNRSEGSAGRNAATFSEKEYLHWRSDQLADQLAGFAAQDEFEGKDVLDFGCGHGDLTLLLARSGVKSITGIDLSEERVGAARKRALESDLPVEPRILAAGAPDTIDLPDASFDRILCFDVLEHIMDPEPIVAEWRRLLRPDGQILIWWVPWLNPWGHHIESLIPIPWAHVLFSDRTLTRACARVYDLPEFEPRVWDLDEIGEKKPNKWQDMSRLPEVNRLTIRAFERLARHSGLEIHERLIHGFSGGRLSRATRFMTRLPIVGEFFTAYVTYRLSSAGLF